MKDKDFMPIMMATFKKKQKITSIAKDKEKLELLHTVSGM